MIENGRGGIVMKNRKWFVLLVCICLMAGICLPATADGVTGAQLKMRMATRTGPSTAYTEPGTFFQDDWQYTRVDVISKAYGSGVWWVQVEFRDSGKLYRAYTGVKRVDVDLNGIAQEQALGTGTLSTAGDTPAYYGPGTQYAKMKDAVPWGAEGTVVMAENGYVLLDYYDEYLNQQRRAWLPSDNVDVSWYSGAPQESIPENLADIQPGTVFRRLDDNASFCQVMDYREKSGYSVMNLYLWEAGYFGNVYVYMDSRDHGTFALANGINGEVWFNSQTIAIEAYMPQYGIDSVLVFGRQ